MKYLFTFALLVGSCFAQTNLPLMGVGGKAAAGGGGTWSLVQAVHVASFSNGTSSTATISVGAGHLLVIPAAIDGTGTGAETISSVTAGFCSSGWVMPAGVNTFDSGGAATTGAYCITSAAQTSATITISFAGGFAFNFYPELFEYAWSGTTIAVDGTPSSTDNTVATTTPSGRAITISGTKDVCVQWIRAGGNVTAISGSYTSPQDLGTTAAYGWAGWINTSSGAAPTWTLALSRTSAVAGMCFSGT